MIPLVAAIVLLCMSIVIYRQLLRMRDWYLWAYLLVETFMKNEPEQKKLEVLRCVGKKRFRLMMSLMSDVRFQKYLLRHKPIYDQGHSMRNYFRLLDGIALYETDYKALQEIIEYEGAGKSLTET